MPRKSKLPGVAVWNDLINAVNKLPREDTLLSDDIFLGNTNTNAGFPMTTEKMPSVGEEICYSLVSFRKQQRIVRNRNGTSDIKFDRIPKNAIDIRAEIAYLMEQHHSAVKVILKGKQNIKIGLDMVDLLSKHAHDVKSFEFMYVTEIINDESVRMPLLQFIVLSLPPIEEFVRLSNRFKEANEFTKVN